MQKIEKLLNKSSWNSMVQQQTMSIQLISKHNLCYKKGDSQPLEERIQGLGRTITFP
jgi:hypothetical protein